MAVITANQPKTAAVPNAKKMPNGFFVLNELNKPTIARIATSPNIKTIPIENPPLSVGLVSPHHFPLPTEPVIYYNLVK